MKLTEKTAYLKGFYEGLDLTDATEATRIIGKLVEALDEAAAEIAKLEERIAVLEDYTDELDEDLGEVESIVYEPHHHCPPPPHHHCHCDDEYDDDDEDYDDDFDDEDYDDCDDIIEVECPGCDETICLPTTIDLAHVICPACGEEFSCICDCDDCDCDDCDDCDCEECGDDEGK